MPLFKIVWLGKIYFEEILPVSTVLPLPCVPEVWVPREVALCPHVPASLMVWVTRLACLVEPEFLQPRQRPNCHTKINGLIRQSLNRTGNGTRQNGSLYIMLNNSHCNLCGNLNGTYTLALYQSRSRSQHKFRLIRT